MSRNSVLLVVLGLLFGLVPATASVAAVSEGAATDACRTLPGVPQQGCDTMRSGTHGAAATCRRAGAPEVCTPLNGQHVAQTEVDAYLSSDTARWHDLQRRLQEDTPLRHATFVSTHNSYNSYAYRPTPSRMDANQTYSLSQQLDLDVRRLELDVHTWTDVETGQTAPILCHATDDPRPHTGCSAEMTLTQGLQEIDAWLDAHPDEIVMLRMENHLDGAEGYDQAAATVREVIGDHLFLPPATEAGCAAFDLDLTRADIRAGGQVMLVSDCGQGEAWAPLVFDDGAVRVESTVRDQDFSYPTCAGIQRSGSADEVSYDSRWIRFYDDATLLSSYVSVGGTAPQRVTPEIARGWVRCGVNQQAFDHLTPTDGRLDALVWTFRDGPGDGALGCATVAAGAEGFTPVACDEADALLQLCRGADGDFNVASTCQSGSPAVPRSGYEVQRAGEVVADAGVPTVVIGLRQSGGNWVPLQR